MNEVKERLKGFFNAGDKPSEAEFAELIDFGVYLDKKGDLGIGTDQPEAKLHINAVADTEVVIRDDGKVGIGTKSPSEKLEVDGKIKTQGIEVSQDIRHNDKPVVGFLESPSSNPAVPIRAKKLTGTFEREKGFLLIPHGIPDAREKVVAVIPHAVQPATPVVSFSLEFNTSGELSPFSIERAIVLPEDIELDRVSEGHIDVPMVVFVLYLDQ